MKAGINIRIETPENMEIADFEDYVNKAVIDFSIKTKCNIEKVKVKELAPKDQPGKEEMAYINKALENRGSVKE